jgi:phospholipase/carboxylesterase
MDYAQIINCRGSAPNPGRRTCTAMSTTLLPCVELTTGPAPELTIVWLHGLGADGHDFEPIVAELGLPFSARFVFPHAPVRPITINQGLPMRAWFDILTFERGGREDLDAIRDSARRVTALIERERTSGFSASQIVLAGFSQGAALALHLGLRLPERLAGIIALSGFLAVPQLLASEQQVANARTPIFMAHGVVDPIVELAFAESSLATLRGLGHTPEWHTYPMAHAVCADEIDDIARWLSARARETRGPKAPG